MQNEKEKHGLKEIYCHINPFQCLNFIWMLEIAEDI